MYDVVCKIKNSTIHHGPKNNRIYLMHLNKKDIPEIINILDVLSYENNYSKIFAKVPETCQQFFSENGYVLEAYVPNYFDGIEKCFFMCKYKGKERAVSLNPELNKNVIKTALNKIPQIKSCCLPEGFSFKIADECNAEEMASLYSKVFESYPFPIFDPEYIKATMNENIVYFGIWKNNELAALSSCEICFEEKNVEMTDFAVHPEYRGNNLSFLLLSRMESEMRKRSIKTAYTIARAESFGMNITFASFGYSFSGTLKNNTNIGGKIEDMNVWFKSLI